ncbi:MAG: iron dicitrate transport regulator FecR [Planctomycetes bacterium]|nr:iron dicitrate transport regulator FecR [Planctomycetota bacterium]
MNHDETLHARMRPLLAALRDDALTDEQARLLESLLAEHAEARRIYLQYMNQSAGLRGYATDLSFAADGESPEAAIMLSEALLRQRIEAAPPAVSRHSMVLTRWALAASLLLAVALGAALLMQRHDNSAAPSAPTIAEANPSEQTDVDTGPRTIAVLTRAVDAAWAGGDTPTEIGAALKPGMIELTKGLAQIEFYSGATVVLEGPAKFELVSAKRGIVRSGRVRAHVPVPAHGFTLEAADMDVVDLGTEFGLNVDATGHAEVHVFDGEVELHHPRDGAPMSLTTGHGMRLESNGSLTPISIDDHAFMSSARLATLADRDRDQRLATWKLESERIKRDPSVVLYYTFDDQPAWQRTLRDQRENSDGSRDGAIVGCDWSTGRWPGKGALQFKRLSDRVRVSIPGTYESLTLAAWVRFDAFDRWLSSLMLTDSWGPGHPHWHVTWEGEMILGVGGNSRIPSHNYYTAKHLLGSEDLGRWVHLVTVYDAPAGKVTHYLDGRVVSTESITANQPLTMGPTAIGNWSQYNGPADKARTLNGSIDEFIIFSRPLAADEVSRMYEAGKPQ